jgi:hypothetical protein
VSDSAPEESLRQPALVSQAGGNVQESSFTSVLRLVAHPPYLGPLADASRAVQKGPQ